MKSVILTASSSFPRKREPRAARLQDPNDCSGPPLSRGRRNMLISFTLFQPDTAQFDQITASNLLKVDIADGHLIEPLEYERINAGVVMHGAI
jgi:hypothetical protein